MTAAMGAYSAARTPSRSRTCPAPVRSAPRDTSIKSLARSAQSDSNRGMTTRRRESRNPVVVRGGVLGAALLRQDAVRNHAVNGSYGISGFDARDLTVDGFAQQAPLIRLVS